MRISQVLVGAGPGDAVTGAALSIQALLEAGGQPSEIYGWHIDPRLADRVRPLPSFPRGEVDPGDDLVVLHVSIGQPEVSSWLRQGRERLVVCYHNISPSAAFVDPDPTFAGLLDLGRRDLVELRERTELALADSAYNAAELVALGYRDVRVSPLVYDPRRLTEVVPHPPTVNHLQEAIDGPIVLAVGQLLPHKRPDWLIQAFFALSTYLVPEASLILAGAHRLPRYTAAIRVFLRELNLGRVWLTGHVSDEELAAFYRHADVFVTASEHEGFCAPLLEAMAFDVPVLARDFAAVGETLGNGGLLLAADDPPEVMAEALATLIETPATSRALAARGRRRLADFPAGQAERTFVEHLRSLR
jgi:glycosyltransferase involved in cell wall biosynthesis